MNYCQKINGFIAIFAVQTYGIVKKFIEIWRITWYFILIVNSLISVHSPLTPGWITTYIRRPRTISGKSVTGRLFSSDRFVRRNPARLHQAASGNGGKAKTALRWSPVSARSPSFRIWTIWRWSQQRQMSTRCHLVLRRKKSLPPWRSTVIPINGK